MTRDYDRDHDTPEAVALDHFWDHLLAGDAAPPPDVAPADAATIRAFHARVPHHNPDPRFVARLEARLMDHAATGIGTASPFSVLSSANGRGSQSVKATVPLARVLTQGRWLVAQAATAALLVLTLVGSFLVLGPGLPGRRAAAPVILPAIGETPSTSAALGSPAEFVWAAAGGHPGPRFGELGQPAVDGQGTLWVTDGDNSRFLLYAPDGTSREAWGTRGSGDGEFNFQTSGGTGFGAVAFDHDGNIYVADTGNARIQKFGPDRRFIRAWGSAGPGAEQVSVPVGIAIADNGRVYVSDNTGVIDVFDTEGAWLATWSGLSLPRGLTIDGEGNVWLADSHSGVIAFAPDGTRLATWDASGMREGALDEPMGIAVDAQGRVFVSDRADRVQIFAPDGAFLTAWGKSGFEPGQFRGPIGLVLDGQGDIYVTEDSGHRVQKFNLLAPFGP